jgi:exodeoxyribonuclease VII large subunit
MSRKPQAQWDFGELFPARELRRVLTVTEVTGTVRRLVEKEIGEIWVTGEMTNLRVQTSGHVYFTLKDANAQLSCVLFRAETVANRELLKEGQKFLLQGSLTVYELRGQYQLVVRAIEPQGVGALQIAFEKLKRKLQAEGLFAIERKRPLPRHPRAIGLVTSPTGAAIRDVLDVIQRRQPSLEIVFAPCRVQGEGAGTEIATAIRLVNEWSSDGGTRMSAPEGRLDLILVTRGGGSIEDLWGFNEEAVARAIYESALPVVSAVGHEIDFTIADFVADRRAATPSAAAELITEGAVASRQLLADTARRLRQFANGRIELASHSLEHLAQRLMRMHPRRRLEEQLQHLDDVQASLLRAARQAWRAQHLAWVNLQQRLQRLRPASLLVQRRQDVTQLTRRLRTAAGRHVASARTELLNQEARLRLLSPGNVLARGYSITRDAASGRIIHSSDETRRGQRLSTRLNSGEVRSVVEG